MSSKKINITMPEENLKMLNEFCSAEKINKSLLIREATVQYITTFNEYKEIEKKNLEMKTASEMMERLRKKSKGFIGEKSGAEVIREIRDSR
jgi:metal-responsive CopG/Arc/MetJ family transcriptional regulator